MKHQSQAKEPEADVTDLRCGDGAMGSSRHVAGRTATTTSENLDVTAGETAPSRIEILHQRKTQIGQVAVTFTFGRIKPGHPRFDRDTNGARS